MSEAPVPMSNFLADMSRGERREYLHVENFEAVYDQVRRTWQNPEKAERYHRWAGKLLHPRLIYGPGVEDRMTQEVANGAQAAIAFSHGRFLDPGEIAALADQNDPFDSLKGKTMIGAKVPVFMMWLIGTELPELGAYSIWRDKDVFTGKESPEEKARLKALQKAAGEASIRLEIDGMNQGLHMVKHVEGTRNKGKKQSKHNPLKLLPVRDGFAKTVTGVDPSRDILMMTAAFYYGKWGQHKTWLNPTIYLDIPENQRREDPEEVARVIVPSLQQSVYRAAALHRK
jgi:hypothetical protein